MIPSLIKFKFHYIHCLLGVFVFVPMVAFCQDEGAGDFYLLEADILEKGRTIYAENPQVSEIKPLLERADQALREGPYSVTFKKSPAPSGDIHDYTSMGPYWWPDSTKEDGLPYIRRDGEVNPEYYQYKDNEQLGKLLPALKTLSQAYYFTEDEKYAEHGIHLIRKWFLDPTTKMNPNLNYAQGIPGRTEGRGIGIIDIRNLGSLPDILTIFSHSAHWEEADEREMISWLDEYVDWLIFSKHGRDAMMNGNNHTTWYFAQTIPLALYLGRNAQADSLAKIGLPMILDKMIAKDGSQPHELSRTRSWDYSVMNLEAMFIFAKAGEHLGLDVWRLKNKEGAGIREALDFLAAYLDPKSNWEYEQLGEPNFGRLKHSLYIAGLKLQEDKYIQFANDLRAEKGPFDYFDLVYSLQTTK